MAARQRTTMEWDDIRDRMVLRELRRFKGRAVGKRLKELALMGLEAEKLGMRVVEVDGRLAATSSAMVAAAMTPQTSAPAASNDSVQGSGGIDPEHLAGLEGLLDAAGLGF